MKKFIIGLMLLLTSPVLAQSWIVSEVKGDELKGTKDVVTHLYSDNGKHFQFNEDDDKMFVLKTDASIFNYTSTRGAKGNYIIVGLVGLYDKDNNLVEKTEITFETTNHGSALYPNKYTSKGGNNYKRSKTVLDYLKTKDGYIRFILPLENDTEFDLKVPTLTTK